MSMLKEKEEGGENKGRLTRPDSVGAFISHTSLPPPPTLLLPMNIMLIKCNFIKSDLIRPNYSTFMKRTPLLIELPAFNQSVISLFDLDKK